MLPRTIIVVKGQDSKTFLQGLITQDLQKADSAKEGEYTPLYTGLLTNKGRYNFDFFIIKITDGSYLIDIHEDLGEDLLNLFNFYKLLANITVQIITSLKVFALPPSAKLPTVKNSDPLILHNMLESTKTVPYMLIFQDPRLLALGYRVIANNKVANHSTLLEYTLLRYKNGVLEYPELVREKSIPILCGFDELDALCYNKGCYLGQEFTHSAKHKMLIKKRVLPCKVTQGECSVNAKITIIENGISIEVGYIISTFQDYAFIMLNMAYSQAQLACGKAKLTTILPSWLQVYSVTKE